MFINNKNSGTINVINGKNPRNLYEHQIEAQKELNKINKKDKFSTLLVLPTGAGKTMTSVNWILKNVIDKGKKVLWIAHRHLLLEQASESFQLNSYLDTMINESSFKFRLISGKHDRLIHIKNDEDIIIASKDSLIRNLNLLNDWLKNEEIYLVIDEAHHATAKTYRKIIEYLNNNVRKLKILGLTATPFRTDENERGLLGRIFNDDIVYEISLKDLINKSLLSRPIFEECSTDLSVGKKIGLKALKSIERLDNIPTDIAEEIASNAIRNGIIVKKYMENKYKYGKTIVFALNRIHAIALKKLFAENGVRSEFIISGTSTEFTGIDLTNSKMEESIEKYRDGEIDVLINVNILTEGVDLPFTKTIFLTRPTVSKTLMTQMIGRGLRGEKSGGTKEAYIVSFIDNWNENIAWINPETIIEEETEFKNSPNKNKSKYMRYFSIAKIEEFAKLLDDTIDNSELESIDYIERVPVGMYNFSYLEDEVDKNCQILIYNSTKPYYDELTNDLESIFKKFNIDSEKISNEKLERLTKYIKSSYFDRYIVPAFNELDIENLFKYYAQKGIIPSYYTLDDIDRRKLDISQIAKYIYNEDMGPRKKGEYITGIWKDGDNLLNIYFNNFNYFINQVDTELNKLTGMFQNNLVNNVTYEKRSVEKLTLIEIGKYYPEQEKKLRNEVFGKNKNINGNYECVRCGKVSDNRGKFHIDHIKPLNKGGLTKLDNLQVLCRTCNMIKSDKYE